MRYRYKIKQGGVDRAHRWTYLYRPAWWPFWFGSSDWNDMDDTIKAAYEHEKRNMFVRKSIYLGVLPRSPGDVIKKLGDKLNE